MQRSKVTTKAITKWQAFKTKMRPYMTWKMLMVFGVVWIATTGWAWVFLILGPILHIPWMTRVGGGAQIFFWNPFINEKLLTIPFSIWLYKKIFKEDPKGHEENKQTDTTTCDKGGE